MQSLVVFLKKNALIVAMVVGATFHSPMGMIAPYAPVLIFVMLLLTFSKLSLNDLRLKAFHVVLLSIQLVCAVGAYLLLAPINQAVAEGALICFLAPPATSAAVITAMLGGSLSLLTTYTLICNLMVALIAPMLFSAIGAQQMNIPFLESAFLIAKRVAPLLIAPVVIALLIKRFTPAIHQRIVSVHQLTFWIWVVALAIVTGSTVNALLEQDRTHYRVELALAGVSLAACAIQFLIGRRLGRLAGDPVSAGQGLGQKNTILAIWMAQSYLSPLASIAPATYVLWQNIFNSWQLWKKGKEGKKSIL